jgi:hypothetical protein
MNDPNWDPDELFNPQSLEIPKMTTLPDDIEIADAKELVINVPATDKGSANVFIDDTFAHAVDLPDSGNIQRLERGVLLALHAIAGQPDPVKPLPWNPMASEDKFMTEAGASKTKMILGWLVINYRTLMVHLPENKFVAWSNELQLLIDSKSATAKQLDSNIGRKIHVAEVLPQMHHFLK